MAALETAGPRSGTWGPLFIRSGNSRGSGRLRIECRCASDAGPAKQGLALDKWLSPDVVTVEHKQVKGAGTRTVVIGAAVQSLEVGDPIRVKPNGLGIEDRRALDASRVLDNQRIALRPVGSIHCVQTH